MTNKLFILLIAAASVWSLQAQRLSQHTIADNAHRFASQMKQSPQVTLRHAASPDLPNLHIYNISGGGWVIASGDERTRSILAYSDKGTLDCSHMPENVRAWLQDYERQIAALGAITREELEQSRRKQTFDDTLPAAIAPLLTSTWGQSGYGYNDLTPYDRWMGYNVTTGCVATAMAQVMRYWQWPVQGSGSHRYTHYGDYGCWRYDTIGADFENTLYDWAHMPDSLTDSSSAEERLAVATLGYHCGVAADMEYNVDCHSASSADVNDALYGLKRHFRYSTQARIEYPYQYEDLDWINMLRREIVAGRPVPYVGGGTYNSAHAFVFDGYDQYYFHVNWGWYGDWDGYFSHQVLHPGTLQNYYIFDDIQYCIIGLEPRRRPEAVIVQASDIMLDSAVYAMGQPVTGTVSFINAGDTAESIYVRFDAVYLGSDDISAKTICQPRLTIAPGDTLQYHFSGTANMPEGRNYLYMLFGRDSIVGEINRRYYYNDRDYKWYGSFVVENHAEHQLANLFVYYRHSDGVNRYTTRNYVNSGMESVVKPRINALFYNQIGLQTLFASQLGDGRFNQSLPVPFALGYHSAYDPANCPEGDTLPYPVCGPSQREIELVAYVARCADSLQMVDSTLAIDSDGDGEIDNLVLVDDGMYTNPPARYGAAANHASRYPDSLPPLFINGKRVGSYTMLVMDNEHWEFPSDDMSKAVCRVLGLPGLDHKVRHLGVQPTADNSILANGYRAPSAIFKQRYLGLCAPPVRIVSDGTYTIDNSDESRSNNLYYIQSELDSTLWYLIEYRRFYSTCTSNGIYISRWNNNAPIDACAGGNTFADYYNTPNTFWTFRPGSCIDTVNGTPYRAFFSAASGRTRFCPTSDPHPCLADGTPELGFKVYDIAENGTQCTFKVHFYTPDEDPLLDTLPAVAVQPVTSQPDCSIYPNPAHDEAVVQVSDISGPVLISVADMSGRIMRTLRLDCSAGLPARAVLRNLRPGAYFVRVAASQFSSVKKLIIKM